MFSSSPPGGRVRQCPSVLVSRPTDARGQALWGVCLFVKARKRKIDMRELFLFNCSLTFDPPFWEPVVSLTNYGISLLFNDLSPW